MSEGTWRSAQYPEMHPLDAATPAPVPLLLEARKHAKLVDKSQRQEDYRGGKGNWKYQERNRWNQDDWSKGKGDKGKKGKGKGRGKGQWSQPQGGWDNYNQHGGWWNKQREDKGGKDDKGEKEKKKDGEK